jgi:hypothetical protein
VQIVFLAQNPVDMVRHRTTAVTKSHRKLFLVNHSRLKNELVLSLSFFSSAATSLFVRHVNGESTSGARGPGPPRCTIGPSGFVNHLNHENLGFSQIVSLARVTAGMPVPRKFQKTAQERRFCDKGWREIGHKSNNVKSDNGFIE